LAVYSVHSHTKIGGTKPSCNSVSNGIVRNAQRWTILVSPSGVRDWAKSSRRTRTRRDDAGLLL